MSLNVEKPLSVQFEKGQWVEKGLSERVVNDDDGVGGYDTYDLDSRPTPEYVRKDYPLPKGGPRP